MKGRAACEIDTADELLAVELLLNGTFSSLDSAQLVALASCLIPVEKSTEEIKLTAQMAGPLAQLQVRLRAADEGSGPCKGLCTRAVLTDAPTPRSLRVPFAALSPPIQPPSPPFPCIGAIAHPL